MKRIMIIIILSLSAIYSTTIGFIDSQLLLTKYNKAVTAQSELAQQQKELQDILVEKNKELEDARKQDKSEEELLQLKDDLESEVNKNRDELLALNKKLSAEIENNIIAATQKIAKKLRIDVVLDKQVVIHGDVDLTSLVISELNK